MQWCGNTTLFARTRDAETLFRSRSEVRLQDLYPDLVLLCCRLGWNFFEITWLLGRGQWTVGDQLPRYFPQWYCPLWFRELGSLVFMELLEKHGSAAQPDGCRLRPAPWASAWPRVPFAICVTSLPAAEFAHRWDRVLGKPDHECGGRSSFCAALALEELADHTLVYLRSCGFEPFVYIGAFRPDFRWRDVISPLMRCCAAHGMRFVNESGRPVWVRTEDVRTRQAEPIYAGQPLVVAMRTRIPPAQGRCSDRFGSRSSKNGRNAGKVESFLGRDQPALGRVAGSSLIWKSCVYRLRGPATAYVLAVGNTHYPAVHIPLACTPRSKEPYASYWWDIDPPPTFYTVWAGALTSVGWCVAGGSLPFPSDRSARADLLQAQVPLVSPRSEPRWRLLDQSDVGLLLSAELRSRDVAGSVLYRHRFGSGRLKWSVATRDMRWAVPLLLWSRHTDRRRAWWYVPRRLGPYLACFGSDRACFIVDEARVRRFLEPDRVAVLQRSLLAPGGLGRVLSRIALATVVGGVTFVRDSVAGEFEEALTTAAVAAGARIEWVELSRLDQLVNPPPIRIEMLL